MKIMPAGSDPEYFMVETMERNSQNESTVLG